VILNQPGQFAADLRREGEGQLRDEYRIKQVTKSRRNAEELVKKLDDVNADAALKEIKAYNAAVRTDIPFNLSLAEFGAVIGTACCRCCLVTSAHELYHAAARSARPWPAIRSVLPGPHPLEAHVVGITSMSAPWKTATRRRAVKRFTASPQGGVQVDHPIAEVHFRRAGEAGLWPLVDRHGLWRAILSQVIFQSLLYWIAVGKRSRWP